MSVKRTVGVTSGSAILFIIALFIAKSLGIERWGVLISLIILVILFAGSGLYLSDIDS